MNISKLSAISVFACLAAAASGQTPDIINTIAGAGPNSVPALGANLQYPSNTAVDSSGNYYIVASGGQIGNSQNRVFKVTSSGTLTVLAGNGFGGYSGDGGPAASAQLYYPSAVAVDSSGNVYIADTNNNIIRKVSASTGNISTVAGTPQSAGYSGDGGQATSAQLYDPEGVALDSSGNLYIADTYNHIIRKVNTSGIISTVAGTPQSIGYSGDGGQATSAQLTYPGGVALDSSGNLYIADTNNHIIRKVNTSGIISTVAGTPQSGGYSGDGGAATSAQLYYPWSVAVDGSGKIYIADTYNYRIRKVATGTISTVAGNGTPGFSGDNGSGTSAEINTVYGIAADSAGRVFIADIYNCVIRELTTAGIIKTVAGVGQTCSFSGDGGAATSANLYYPFGVAVDSSDNMYIADSYSLRIRKAALGGTINTIAGNGSLYFAGSGTPATGASFYSPTSAVPDASGNVYIADQQNCIVRKVDTSGTITTVAGMPGQCGYGGDGGAATSALLYSPTKSVADASGNLYIADLNNCAIRKVAAGTGIITTYAGIAQSCGFNGDGGPATSAQIYQPSGLTLDASNNLYIADNANSRIRKVTSAGIISTIAGNGSYGYSGDGGLATNAMLSGPTDVAVSPSGNVYIADSYNSRVRMVNTSGIITTVAGNGTLGFQADGVPAIDTSLYYPSQVAVDAAGDLLIADRDNGAIRWVNGAGIIYTIAGNYTNSFSGDGGLATLAALSQPWGVGVDIAGNVFIADSGNNRIRKVNSVPNVNSSSYSLSFPQQALGTFSQPQAITLTGIGPATITSLTATGDFLESDNCPASLTAGATCEVEIVFGPTKVGTRTGTLTIVTNSYFNNMLTINLSGVGGGLVYTPTSINFGAFTLGKSSTVQKITYTNKSTTAATFTSVTSNNAEFAITANTCTGSLAANKSCIISVVFTPSAVGTRSATITVVDSDNTSPQLIPLRGVGDGTSLSTTSLAYGKVIVGTTSVLNVTLNNVGTATLTGISTTVTGTNAADFTRSTCGTTLAPGANCTYSVTFKPAITGAESATLNIKDNEGTFKVTLSGTGQGTSLTPATLSYGTVTRGSMSTLTATLKNAGTTTLTSVSAAVSGTNAADFTFTTTCGTTLASAASCTYSVTFKPTIVGPEAATLNVTDNEGTFPVALSGTGQ